MFLSCLPKDENLATPLVAFLYVIKFIDLCLKHDHGNFAVESTFVCSCFSSGIAEIYDAM